MPSVKERNLRALLVVAATNNTAWDLVTPFIPLFILTLVEGDPVAAAAWSGIALGISPLMTALAGPFWGAFAERYGARPAMLRTLLMAPCLVVLIAFSTAIWQVIVLRFLIGVFGGFYVLVHAMAAQTAPRDRVGQTIGLLQAISMICLALIPPVAGLFTDIWGIRSNFLLAAGIMLISFAVMWRGYTSEPKPAAQAPPDPESTTSSALGSAKSSDPEAAAPSRAADGKRPRSTAGTYWSLLRSPELALVALIVFVGNYVERTFWPLAPLLIVEMTPASDQIGLMTGAVLGIGSAATALSALAVGRLARRVPARRLLLASLACGVVTLPLLVVVGSFWEFVAARVVMGLLTGGVVTLAYAHVSTLLPSDRLSVSFSMFASVAMVAAAVGPVSLGTLAATAGLRSPLLVGTAGFACCFLLLLLTARRSLTASSTPRPADASRSHA